MIKRLIKILSGFFFLIILAILYLSFVGIKTEKLNKKITDQIFKINKKITVDLKDVKFLLNPYDFTVNITTKNPTILLGDNKLQIESVKTNILLKSLYFEEFSMDDLQISTKAIKLNDIILLAKSFKNSIELFLLDRVIKDGFLIADIKLKFDKEGKVKDDYQINGFVKNAKFKFLNKLTTKNLNLKFAIFKNKYSLTKVKTDINGIKLSSSLIEINEDNGLYSIRGKILTDKKDFSRDQLNAIPFGLLNNQNIEKARFSSENSFSFDVGKRLKFNNINIESKINLDQLVIKNDFIDLKAFLPDLEEVISFRNHKIIVNYDKNKLDVKGNGEILIKDKIDSISYEVVKNNGKFIFDTKINLKNNKLLIDFLEYEKKVNLDASILIKGNFKDNKPINFDLISLIENKNKIFFKNLNLSKDFKIISIDSFSLNYLNKRRIKNKLIIKKNNSNYNIEGESFDAIKLINKIMNSDDENSTLFKNFNSKINIKISKIYIDEVNFMNDLSGILIYKNNQIYDLKFKSFFPNNKKINFLIKTNDQQEKITELSTDYPRPLIERYDFIKGFQEGFLVYRSIKKDGISSGLLTIDNFKVQEAPVFAKLLSLASLQGIADLLTGEGIRFTDFEMKFSNKNKLTNIEEMYAIGPAVSILLDGYIDSKKLVSLRGTLVPATTINRTIASIPLLGNILVGKKIGEGVFGVSFKVKGNSNDLKTTVNPIKTLTPRFITRTLEKIKKN